MINLKDELVFIHAHICGDGNMYECKVNRSPSSMRNSRSTKPYMRYTLEYTNTCPKLLKLMTKNIKSLFPENYVYRSDKKHRIQARNKILYDTIRSLGYKDGNDWTIPKEIVCSSKFRKIWLRAFFDDEGSVRQSCILGYNTNKKAILRIKKMLNLEGFNTKVYIRLPKNKKHKICYTIRIPARYYILFKKIGFDHTNKNKDYHRYYNLKVRRAGAS